MKLERIEEKASVTGLDFRMVISVGICCLTATFLNYFGLKFSYGEMQLEVLQKMTACITCLLVVQDTTKISYKSGVTRMIITAIGGGLAVLVVLADTALQNQWAMVVMVMLGVLATLYLCKLAKVPAFTTRIGGVTFILVALTLSGHARVWYALFRLMSTLYGVLVVLVVTWMYERIRQGTAARMTFTAEEGKGRNEKMGKVEKADKAEKADKISWNPYLPLHTYIPDGEPHVFGDRVYLYGSHDEEDGSGFCPLDYEVWSAPLKDLSDWKCEGVAYRRSQDPANADGTHYLYAPDVVRGNDGKYYLYYGLDLIPQISVAVSENPAGPFDYLGNVMHPDGEILTSNMPYDPAVINDEGHIYLYYGFAPHFATHGESKECPGCSFVELCDDMLTIKGEPEIILPAKKHAKGTEYEGHAFFEAASIRKIEGTYYLVYCSEWGHELCYATADKPQGPYAYRGVIISNADIGYLGREDGVWSPSNNHGGIARLGSEYYIFYHRHTHGTMYCRQGCAERIRIGADGKIAQVEMSSMGLYGNPLPTDRAYPASICCNLIGASGCKPPVFGRKLEDVPIVDSENHEQYIKGVDAGSVMGYKYFDFQGETRVKIFYRGSGTGKFVLGSDEKMENVLGEMEIAESATWTGTETKIFVKGTSALFFRYEGSGSVDVKTLQLDMNGKYA